jgi:putative thioredoxin
MVREVLARFLPSESDKRAQDAEDLEQEGNLSKAKKLYEDIVEKDPNHSRSLLGLGRLLMNEGDHDGALGVLERISLAAEERKEADRLLARLKLRGEGNQDESTLRAAVQSDPKNLAARFNLAQTLGANEKFEDALTEFLTIVKTDRGFKDDGARKAMVQIFEVLGSDHPLTDKYRGELAKVLFS